MTEVEVLTKVGRIARNSGERLEPEEAMVLLRDRERLALSAKVFPNENQELAQFATGEHLRAWLEQCEEAVTRKRTRLKHGRKRWR